MRARHQLNAIYAIGCVLAAIVTGLMLQSWLVFAVALTTVLAISIHDGGIRLTQRPTAGRSAHRQSRRGGYRANQGRSRFRKH